MPRVPVKDGRFRVELTVDRAAPAGLNRGQTLDIRVTLGSTAPALVAPVGAWLEAGDSFQINQDDVRMSEIGKGEGCSE